MCLGGKVLYVQFGGGVNALFAFLYELLIIWKINPKRFDLSYNVRPLLSLSVQNMAFLNTCFDTKTTINDLFDTCFDFCLLLLRWSNKHHLGHVLRVMPILTQNKKLCRHLTNSLSWHDNFYVHVDFYAISYVCTLLGDC